MKRKIIYVLSIILLVICMFFVVLFLVDFYKNKLLNTTYIAIVVVTGILSQIGLYYNLFSKKR